MIKAAFILALLASGGALTLAAGNEHHVITLNPSQPDAEEGKKPETVYNWIEHVLDCPEFLNADDANNRVELWIHINEDGSVAIKNLLGVNPKLVSYVKKNLEGKMYKSSESGKDFHFAIRFRRIS